ncbi:aspartic peptidase domain-containing protein [Massariosphaeria phaeospora]|uniref:Aspartic peptidase domain-containing protein n=1 Tax=Massariosphaeria phaeospora TaxID=100035 RepID=A0A7C8ME34_9PLEO|nr:aspartic peptidase domain-containing protein [Massariosphaeria phaeospora]
MLGLLACILSLANSPMLLVDAAVVPQNDPLVFNFTVHPQNHGTSVRRRAEPEAAIPLTYYRPRLGIDMSIEGTKFHLNVDTGSWETWVARSTFVCADIDNFDEDLDQEDCGIETETYKGKVVKLSGTEQKNADMTYASGERVQMTFSRKDVVLGKDQKVQNARVGFASRLAWEGDGRFAGVFGLDWESTTPSLWQYMCKQKGLPLQFTIATNREKDAKANGGSLSIGGTLGIAASEWTSVKTAQDEGWVIGELTAKWDSGAKEGNTIKGEILIDSGNAYIMLPNEIIEDFTSAFCPPPFLMGGEGGYWMIDCNSESPENLIIQIGGKDFAIPVRDNIIAAHGNACMWKMSGADNYEFDAALGIPFMRHAYVNFNSESRTIGFAQRNY